MNSSSRFFSGFFLILLIVCVFFYRDRIEKFRQYFVSFSYQPNQSMVSASELEKLKSELLIVKNTNYLLNNYLVSEERWDKKLHNLQQLVDCNQKKISSVYLNNIEVLKKSLKRSLCSQYAQVISRDSSSWQSAVWINVGKQSISINSPVLKGEYLVGLVDYVGNSKSRVRLISDPQLTLSVCVKRKDAYLARGELIGSSSIVWRSYSSRLKGVGFNYEQADNCVDAGGDLITDCLLSPDTLTPCSSVIQKGDCLVTTGLDNVFPRDLPVAMVSHVDDLDSNSVYTNIIADLYAGQLDDLNDLIVMEPLFYE